MGTGATRWAWDQHDVTPSEKLALLALADQADGFHDCDWLGFKHLVGRTGLSRSTLTRALRGLIGKQLIQFRENAQGKFCHLSVPAQNPPTPPDDEWVTVTADGVTLTPKCITVAQPCLCHGDTLMRQGDACLCHGDTSPSAHINGTRAHAEKDLPAKEYRPRNKNFLDSSPQLSLAGTDKPQSEAPITVEELVGGWNDICGSKGMPKVIEVNSERRRKTLLRIKEHPKFEWWQRTFNNLANSTFCRQGWCKFDWAIANGTNALKAFEGGYH